MKVNFRKQTVVITLLHAATVLAMACGLALATPPAVVTADCTGAQCIANGADAAQGIDPSQPTQPKQPTLGDRVRAIVNILLYVLGAIAVIMIVIGGVRYVTSSGDSGATTSAKNAILYAVVGLVVAILAYSIVNFVITSFSK